MLGNVQKFSFGEMTSNNSGKTSSTTTAGIYIVAIGGLCFFMGVIDKMLLSNSIDIVSQSILFTSIGATLLGVKNVMTARNDKAASELIAQSTNVANTESANKPKECVCKNSSDSPQILHS